MVHYKQGNPSKSHANFKSNQICLGDLEPIQIISCKNLWDIP